MGRRSRRHSAKPRPSDGAHPANLPTAASPAPAPAPAPGADPNSPIIGGNPNHDLELNLNPDANPNPNPNPNPNSGIADAGRDHYMKEQEEYEVELEKLLLKGLNLAYDDALSHLVSLGYEEALALRAVLCKSPRYGSMDIFSNIINNAIAYLNSSPPPNCHSSAFPAPHHLGEYYLADLVCHLQKLRPHLTRSDAMCCLIVSNLDISRASDIPFRCPVFGPAPSAVGISNYAPIHPATGSSGRDPLLCNLWHSYLESLARNFLKQNSPTFYGRHPTEQQHNEDVGRAAKDLQDPDTVTSVTKSLESMSIADDKAVPEGGTSEVHKKEMILDIIRHIQELRAQVKEQQEWAQQKALQAARKLSSDLAELKALQAEREENQGAKKGKQVLEDSTMKLLSETEVAFKKVSGQLDHANEAVQQLETENVKIRADIEASKLNASESTQICLDVEKREKKFLKRLLALEKLQEEIAEERSKIAQIQQQLNEVQEAQKVTEMKWRQEIKAKELAISLVEEGRRAKEAVDVNMKRKHQALRQKIEIDLQPYKDDIRRLEEELSHLKASAGSTQLSHQTSNSLGSEDAYAVKLQKEANMRLLQGSNKPQTLLQINRSREANMWLLQGSNKSQTPLQEIDGSREANMRLLQGSNKPQTPLQEINRSWECRFCGQNEVSVLFLPCAHQVLCFRCNEEHEKRAKASCPCCNIQIEQRVRVYGAGS